jgi:hypothetical protein
MDIICKDCGHGIDDHLPDGCFHCENGTTSVNNTCLCDRIPSEVAEMFFTELQARLDTCRAQVTALIAERDAAQKEAEERRANFEIMLNRLLGAEQKHAETKAQLNYVLADNAQLRAVLVQFLEWANSEGLIKDFSEIIKKLQTSLNIMGDPREKHD